MLLSGDLCEIFNDAHARNGIRRASRIRALDPGMDRSTQRHDAVPGLHLDAVGIHVSASLEGLTNFGLYVACREPGFHRHSIGNASHAGDALYERSGTFFLILPVKLADQRNE